MDKEETVVGEVEAIGQPQENIEHQRICPLWIIEIKYMRIFVKSNISRNNSTIYKL